MRSFMVLAVLLMLSPILLADDPAPGNMQLLPGYVHRALQGFDSRPGEITKEGGVKISYDIGRVTKPGGLALGGDFSDRANQMPAANRKWYKEQTIHGEVFHLAFSQKNALTVSLPNSGANFHVEVKTSEQLSDALLMILSYGTPPAKE